MSWSILLDGDLRREAEEVLRSYASNHINLPGPSLAGGTAGLALFWGSLALDLELEGAQARCEEALSHTFDMLSEATADCSLYQGLAGIAWMLVHLQQRGLLDSQEEALAQIEPLLLEYARRQTIFYDLIFGHVGHGVYGLSRLDSPWGKEFLGVVAGRLAGLAIPTEHGATWYSPPESYYEFRDQFPDGNFNVGLAHGVPGIVFLLARCAAAGIHREESDKWAREGARWVLSQRNGDRFPSRWYHNRPPDQSRDAWCYGNPGVGIALLGAAKALKDAELEREAITILLETAAPGRETGVIDAGVCHGSAGLAHIFNRAWQATGDTRLKEAAIEWIRQTLQYARRAESGEVYFDAGVFPKGEKGKRTRIFERAEELLTGGLGVGLVLLSATSANEPGWDNFLMTDVPAEQSLLARGT